MSSSARSSSPGSASRSSAARCANNHYEADYRAGLLHVRRNGEQIAFSHAQRVEQDGLRSAFANIRRNFYQLMLANAGLSAGQDIYQRTMQVVPLFLTVPKYFAGAITFGQVQAARDAFTQFAASLSYIVTAYPSIARQVANINRLKALDDAIDYERGRAGSASRPAARPTAWRSAPRA
ncbi:SbmA/BacA-like family transporter [Caulobacter segnis]